MEQTEKTTSKKKIIAISLVLALIILGLGAYALLQHHQMKEMVEQLEFEKESLQDEYEDLAIQFDGYQKMDIQNDSLQDQLAQEQQRVRDLLEELRITKVTNARRIAELKKELATVRAVMVEYVHQIDSLNRTNMQLTEENKQYRRQNAAITEANSQLTEQNTQLTRVVTRAAMLEVDNFQFMMLNKRDRKTNYLSQTKKLQFNYTIQKNITCETGEKIVYLILRRPNGEVMVKDTNHVFIYEEQEQPYSIRQQIVYSGDILSESMYWVVEEEPSKGRYTAEFFIDGNLCGSFPFELD